MKFDLLSLTLEEYKAISRGELTSLADEIRNFLIDSTVETGGHIGANLGVVELTMALHHYFRSPVDMLVFDTGHIGYTHKILTGRAASFKTLNTYGGMSRFITPNESEHDFIEASHAGTSISLAIGRAISHRNQGLNHWTIAFIGDGALAEGLALEALNHASAEKDLRLIIVLNDNGYAISPGFGALHEHFKKRELNSDSKDPLFLSLGYDPIGPIDGHSFDDIFKALDYATNSLGVCIIHAKTEKGRGLPAAKNHPYKMHYSFPYDSLTGSLKESSSIVAYQDIASEAISDCMGKDETLVAITPSTLYATGMSKIFSNYPNRCFDPGMEEQHAVSMAVGMALSGLKPILFYQSTFLQRAFDQLIHDVCFSNQDILILSVRSGFAGYDNPTHHGIYDLSYLRCLPNLQIFYPRNSSELYSMITVGLSALKGPVLILMPYGAIHENDALVKTSGIDINQHEVLIDGEDGIVISVGNKITECADAIDVLRSQGLNYSLVNLRKIQPLPETSLLQLIKCHSHVVTVEEGVLEGGVGASISAFMHRIKSKSNLTQIGLPRKFIEAGSNQELCEKYCLDANGIANQIINGLKDL